MWPSTQGPKSRAPGVALERAGRGGRAPGGPSPGHLGVALEMAQGRAGHPGPVGRAPGVGWRGLGDRPGTWGRLGTRGHGAGHSGPAGAPSRRWPGTRGLGSRAPGESRGCGLLFSSVFSPIPSPSSVRLLVNLVFPYVLPSDNLPST